ncbi:phosphatidylinositol 4,5-bisphosphate 5-phosphatase A isoform X4 [Halyomorpha halys]|uniref:phosphatidylinositol 4,5-bisphosphate 5-phosphatase A isoform X4 n=1 Tax=Halyomorpha halys TaxID=286706 RepID=UPI0006D4E228|nr:phosphatidylinositol 4,5-bisphosphate 5-phosphatase A isoform X3 [Halyomorpha halys]
MVTATTTAMYLFYVLSGAFLHIFVFSSATEDARLVVQITTWNVNHKSPPEDLTPLLGLSRNPDVIAVGLQEVAVSPHEAILNTILVDKWTRALDQIMEKKAYAKVGNVAMVGIILNVYVQERHKSKASVIDHARVRTGFKGLYGNKGGVALMVLLYESTLTFVAAHLHPNDGALEKRIEDFLVIEKRRGRSCSQEDYTFWFGDFNFRLYGQAYTANKIQHMVQKGNLEELLSRDQLTDVRQAGRAFKGYEEMQITFKPTYRYTVGTDSHDLQRRPAWTDRVLYRAAEGREVIPVQYSVIPDFSISDHKPVEAVFLIAVAT